MLFYQVFCSCFLRQFERSMDLFQKGLTSYHVHMQGFFVLGSTSMEKAYSQRYVVTKGVRISRVNCSDARILFHLVAPKRLKTCGPKGVFLSVAFLKLNNVIDIQIVYICS